jgi:Asp-tRNA(Asn)/Glu-tRNA(Gln) amidotransferase A subunit family amidase
MQATNFITATETRRQLKNGIIDIPQTLKDHQARYEKRDGDVQAWILVRHQELIREEKGRHRAGHASKRTLSGITVGVEDNMSEIEFAFSTVQSS